MSKKPARRESRSLSRRGFIAGCAAASALAGAPASLRALSWEGRAAQSRDPVQGVLPLDRDWRFGGKMSPPALQFEFDDRSFSQVTVPHSVVPLSWQKWDPSSWQDVWIYRRHFAVPPAWRDMRLFLHFDRVMAGAVPVVNGHSLEQHAGGFLPFDREITGLTRDTDNVVAVAVDARWLNVPPTGSPRGPSAVDYLLPGGMTGSVSLRAVPAIFLKEVFARPVAVLTPGRRVEITCRLDAKESSLTPVGLTAILRRGGRTIGTVSKSVAVEKPDQEVSLTLGDLRSIELWDPDHPALYELEVTLHRGGDPVHRYTTRTGFREARFELDGFYLNGRRTRLFGLNRHEVYPYSGFAVPDRILRRDAEILRRQFNCNIVRCSHYPQSEAFLDACDELGLMVWEELPGWQYIGDESWQEAAVRDVEAMVRRDRNHPSIVIWGTRVNESRNEAGLYQRTRALAKSLDDSRPSSGTMTPSSRKGWQTEWAQDVFAYDDYHSNPDGSVGIEEPVAGVPYFVTETVGQFNYPARRGFDRKYRRAGDVVEQMEQALFHAQAHNRAADLPRCAGVIAWCAFDYASLMNAYNAVKCPGVADVFRIPKLGASFYLAQVDPAVRPVIEPNFWWDFGPETPAGPGERAAIFSNCDRVEVSIGGKLRGAIHPDRAGYPNLRYPPFFADLRLEGSVPGDLRIDGYVGSIRVLSRSFSADRAADRLWLRVDDRVLNGDGVDSTRLVFAAVDRFGALRPFAAGAVSLEVDGPAEIVGDNPFALEESGGAGAVWVRTLPGRTGRIQIKAQHRTLGETSVELSARGPMAG